MTAFWIALGILVLLALLLLLLSFKTFDGFTHRRIGKKNYDESYGDDPALVSYFNSEISCFLSLSPRRLQIHRGGQLVGWYYSGGNRKLALLVHGWRDDSRMRMAYARPWIEAGYSVFIPDLRSHGDSDGKFIGMGCVDRFDILEWIKLLKTFGEEQFVLSGVSMGGATVCALSGDSELPDCVRAIISDCAFSSLYCLSLIMMRRNKLPPRLMTALTSCLCKLRAGYDFKTAQPVLQTAHSHTPTLFIHGEADDFIPFEMCRELYEACSAPKEFWAVPGAAHARAFWTAREEYGKRCVEFASRYITK